MELDLCQKYLAQIRAAWYNAKCLRWEIGSYMSEANATFLLSLLHTPVFPPPSQIPPSLPNPHLSQLSSASTNVPLPGLDLAQGGWCVFLHQPPWHLRWYKPFYRRVFKENMLFATLTHLICSINFVIKNINTFLKSLNNLQNRFEALHHLNWNHSSIISAKFESINELEIKNVFNKVRSLAIKRVPLYFWN